MKNARIVALSICFTVLNACSGGWGGQDEYDRPNMPDHPVTKMESSGGTSSVEVVSTDASVAGSPADAGPFSVETGGASGDAGSATGGAIQIILL